MRSPASFLLLACALVVSVISSVLTAQLLPEAVTSRHSVVEGNSKAIVSTILGRLAYGHISIANKRSYALRKAYDLIIFERALSQEQHQDEKERMFNKPLAILCALERYHYTWVWWLDADTLIMNGEIWFESLLPQENDHVAPFAELIFGGDLLAILNAGSMFVRNSLWSRTLLESIYAHRNNQSVPDVDSWHEQAVLIHLYMTSADVRDHTIILPQRTLNSYTHNFQQGDFVLHFAGTGDHKFGLMKSFSIYSTEGMHNLSDTRENKRATM